MVDETKSGIGKSLKERYPVPSFWEEVIKNIISPTESDLRQHPDRIMREHQYLGTRWRRQLILNCLSSTDEERREVLEEVGSVRSQLIQLLDTEYHDGLAVSDRLVGLNLAFDQVADLFERSRKENVPYYHEKLLKYAVGLADSCTQLAVTVRTQPKPDSIR